MVNEIIVIRDIPISDQRVWVDRKKERWKEERRKMEMKVKVKVGRNVGVEAS